MTETFDDSYKPYKCLKCNLYFADKDTMFDHLRNTSYYVSDEGYASRGTTYFHRIVDKDGDYVLDHKRISN